MDERYYDEFDNKFYNPDDDDARPGDNLNWKKIQRGFKRVEGAAAEDYTSLEDKINDVYELLHRDKAPIIAASMSGAAASFPDGANDLPVKSLVIGIVPVQSGTGDPAPDNIRPITGWTGSRVRVAGKNLLGGEALAEQAKLYMPSTVIDTSEKKLTFGAAASVVSGVGALSGFIPFKPNTAYTIILKGKNNASAGSNLSNLRIIYTDGTRSDLPFASGDGSVSYSIHTTNPNKTVLSLSKTNMTNSTTLYYEECGIFEGSLTVDEFAAYIGKTYPVSWESVAGTVYGGTLDITNGILTVTKGNIASYNGETLPGAWISDRDVYTEGGTPTTGAQVVYDLTEPVIYQITPTEVSTLYGDNNIFADTGAIVDLEYRADTKLYIDSLTEPEDDMIADENITNGSYFMVNNDLYIATAAIAAGEEIVPGTNCTLTDVAAALNALNA